MSKGRRKFAFRAERDLSFRTPLLPLTELTEWAAAATAPGAAPEQRGAVAGDDIGELQPARADLGEVVIARAEEYGCPLCGPPGEATSCGLCGAMR